MRKNIKISLSLLIAGAMTVGMLTGCGQDAAGNAGTATDGTAETDDTALEATQPEQEEASQLD